MVLYRAPLRLTSIMPRLGCRYLLNVNVGSIKYDVLGVFTVEGEHVVFVDDACVRYHVVDSSGW